jgi:hypothetical protein
MRKQPIYRRGVSWDLFDNDSGGPLQLQRVDSPDDGPAMRGDGHAAAYVVAQATWEGNPNVALRDECREALAELIESWQEEESGILRSTAGWAPDREARQ